MSRSIKVSAAEVRMVSFQLVPKEQVKWICIPCRHHFHCSVDVIPRHCPVCDSGQIIDINCERLSPAEEAAALRVYHAATVYRRRSAQGTLHS